MLLPAMRRLAYMLLIVSCSVHAQELKIPDTPETLHLAPPPSERFPAKWYPRASDEGDVVFAPVINHPYTAMEGPITPETDDTSGRQSDSFHARDRLGRTRIDAQSGGFTLGDQEVKTKTVLVSDPVSHCDFEWTQPMTDVEMPLEMRGAHVMCRPQTLHYKDVDTFKLVMEAGPDGISHNGDATTEVKHLAPMKIGGITINRLRVINSRFDEHGQVKNSSDETWYSPELRQIVRQGNEKNGYTGLKNIQLTDPDPKLFYPPDGYRIELQAPQ